VTLPFITTYEAKLMKLETLLLRGLFAACVLICVLAVAGMLHAPTQPDLLADHASVAASSTNG
jgi:hypothetical protein